MDAIERDKLRRMALDMLALAEPCRHSRDFSSVVWYGTAYNFTGAQSHVVRALWEAWANGTPCLRQETLLDAAGSDGRRLAHLFRDHPAWSSMIVAGAVRGTFRLAEPEDANPPEHQGQP